MVGRSWSRDRRGSLRPRACGPRAPKPGAAGLNVLSFNGDELMAMSSSVTSRSVRYVSSSSVHCTDPRIVRGTSGSRVPRGWPGSCRSTMQGRRAAVRHRWIRLPFCTGCSGYARTSLTTRRSSWPSMNATGSTASRCAAALHSPDDHENRPLEMTGERSNGEDTRLYPTSSRPSHRGRSRAP